MTEPEGFFENVADPARFREAIRRIDDANAADPNRERVNGQDHPREWLYSMRLCQWVMRLAPEASECLRLAARAMHLRRWTIPRETYPKDRPGYLRWRSDLKRKHAEEAGEILRETGYDDAVVARVQSLIRKEGLPHDPEAQVLEDALCLVFLEYQLEELASRTGEDKLLNALRKSWAKMSATGREMAMQLALSPKARSLVEKAISSPET